MTAIMKIFCGVLVLVYVVNALPADRIETLDLDKNQNGDSEEIPFRPIIPVDGFLSGFNELFHRLRQQMMELMSQVPTIGSPPEGGNTTSVTKVINGHKVVINETVYGQPDGEDPAAVFTVRVVDIRPDFPENADNSPEVPNKESSEKVEESEENEIPKNVRTSHAQKRKITTKDFYHTNALQDFKDLENFDFPSNNNLETFDAIDATGLESFDTFGDNMATRTSPNLESFDEDEEILGNSIEPHEDEDKAIIYRNKNKNHHEVDLSNDIRINSIAEKQGRPHNPNAEVLDFQPERPASISRDTYVNEIAAARRNFPRNPDAEMIDNIKFERMLPFGDLSGDTYVNEIAARRRMPLNPDAEFMDVVPKNSRYFYRTHKEDS